MICLLEHVALILYNNTLTCIGKDACKTSYTKFIVPEKINKSIYMTKYKIPFNEYGFKRLINIHIYNLSSSTCFIDLIR